MLRDGWKTFWEGILMMLEEMKKKPYYDSKVWKVHTGEQNQ